MRNLVIAAVALAWVGPACAAPQTAHNHPVSKTVGQANADLFRRYGDIWKTGNLDLLPQVIGPGYVGHTSSGDRDAAGLAERIRTFRELYADLTFTVLDQLVDGDRVASRMRITGTVRATGKPVTLIGLNISRFSNGRIVEEWPVWETLK
jgi:predicted ester cyclase